MAMPMTGQGSRSPRPLQVCAPGFVGRETELVAIGDALSMPPAVVLIEGEAGIGKSRLVREFLAAGPAATPGPGRAPARHTASRYTLGAGGGRRARGRSTCRAAALSALGGALRPLFPEWAGQLPPAPEPAEDATAARHRLFRAFAELLPPRRGRAGTRGRPLGGRGDPGVPAVPDPAAAAWRQRGGDVPSGGGAARFAAAAAAVAAPAADARNAAGAGPLDVTERPRLISSMLDGRARLGEFAAFLHERTEGVPLAVEESVRLMVDRADLIRRNGDGCAATGPHRGAAHDPRCGAGTGRPAAP